MKVPVSLFIPNADGLRTLWARFDAERAAFDDNLPSDPIGFVTWLASSGTQAFLVGDPADPDGVFIFSGITPGDAAFVHVFLWGRKKYAPRDLIEAARVTLGAVFAAHGLRRVIGLTPVTAPAAKAFAQAVGFSVRGTLREATLVKGVPTDMWCSDMLRAEVEAALTPPARETIETGG